MVLQFSWDAKVRFFLLSSFSGNRKDLMSFLIDVGFIKRTSVYVTQHVHLFVVSSEKGVIFTLSNLFDIK